MNQQLFLKEVDSTFTILDEFNMDYDLFFNLKKEVKMFYLINFDKIVVAGKFSSFEDADVTGRKSKFAYLVIDKMEDLKKFTLKKLTVLRSNISHLKGKVDSKDKAAPQIWEMIEKADLEIKEIPVKTKKVAGEGTGKTPSKVSLIRELFKTRLAADRKELMKLTGYDSRNIHVAMSILKNPDRTQKTLVTTYDRKTQIYTKVVPGVEAKTEAEES